MRKNLFLALTLSTFLSSEPLLASVKACQDYINQDQTSQNEDLRDSIVQSTTNPALQFSTIVDVNQYKGVSFLTLMREKIKPELDQYASKGFVMAAKDAVVSALDLVSSKVKAQALKAAGTLDNLSKVVEALQGQTFTLYDLPTKIAETKVAVDRFGLTTFLSLASGGGVEVKLTSKDCCYNVNYGTGTQAKDEMTGRSFGQGPGHLADDASDKSYLQSLQSYFTAAGPEVNGFYKSLLQILTNCDTSGLAEISDQGQSVASDFIAIYVAEQDRHLMSDMKSHAWDVSLLEVTLLSAFQSGQSTFMTMFGGKLVDTVPVQEPGGKPRTLTKKADMTDWWQFSSSSDPKSSNRSGINTTKSDFRALGKMISDYMSLNHPDIVQNVEKHFVGQATSGNLFEDLSNFLINEKTSRSIVDAEELIKDFSVFLGVVHAEANQMQSQQLQFQGSK